MEVEIIASRFHGGLAALHALAVWSSLRRKNYFHASNHMAYLIYDAASAIHHNNQTGERT